MVPGDAGASRTTASLVEAYALLRGISPPPAPTAPDVPPEPAGGTPAHDEVLRRGATLLVAGPPAQVYRRLVDIAHVIGEVTYVDPDARLLDTIVVTDDGAACSLLASLRGRAGGTEVSFSIEPLGGDPRPPVVPLVTVVADLLGEPG